MATKTDLFLKYIEEMYLKGTFEKDEQVKTTMMSQPTYCGGTYYPAIL